MLRLPSSPRSRLRRKSRALLALVWSATVVLAQDDPLPARLQALLEADPLDHALAGVRGVELQTGRVVFDHHGTTGFTPASNTKLFSGAFALAKLGAAYRFQSSVRAPTEPDANGVVRGDVTLLAGGDPTLSGRVYPFESCRRSSDTGAALRELASQLAARGVKRIEGDIVGDDTRYPFEPYGPDWTLEDADGGGEAPVSAWMLNDNLVGDGDDERGVRDPALAAATKFRQALLDLGLAVEGLSRARHRPPNSAIFTLAGGVQLATRSSPPLSQILQTMEKCSVNLHAESLLLEAALQVRGELLSRAQALDLEKAFFAGSGVPPEQFEFNDGSGLSRSNLVTPAALTALLLSVYRAPWRDSFLAALAVGGVDGTLEQRFNSDPRAHLIRAKTGTLRHVTALSGYAGDRYAFSIFVNHFFPADRAAVLKAVDTIALEIVKATE